MNPMWRSKYSRNIRSISARSLVLVNASMARILAFTGA